MREFYVKSNKFHLKLQMTQRKKYRHIMRFFSVRVYCNILFPLEIVAQQFHGTFIFKRQH